MEKKEYIIFVVINFCAFVNCRDYEAKIKIHPILVENNKVYCGFAANCPAAPSTQQQIRQYTRSLVRFAHSPARSLTPHIA